MPPLGSILPTTLWAAGLSAYDVRHRVLPNWLTLGGAGLGLLVRGWAGGWNGFTDGLAAGAVAGVFLLVPFLMRGAGGGDVKMLFAAGTMAGWSRVIYLLWFMSLAGLVLALAMLVFGQADGARLKHYARCLLDWRYDRKAGTASLPSRESRHGRVPFGVAIGAGLVLALLMKP